MKRLVKQILGFSVLLMLIQCAPAEKSEIRKGKDIKNLKHKFISLSQLEAAGFEHISPEFFDLLFDRGAVYVLNMKDRLVAKFKDGKVEKVYKGNDGQGPRDMPAPKSIFVYDPDTIAIHDYLRQCVLFFSRDLNYLREQKLEIMYKTIVRTPGGLIAIDSEQDRVFSFLNNQFDIVETLVEKHTKLPFEGFYDFMLNGEYFAGENVVGHTHHLQFNKECKIDIYNLETRNRVITLKWNQPFTPTKETFAKKKDMYCTSIVKKMGKYYVVHNTAIGQLRDRGSCTYDLLIFDEQGKAIFRGDIPFMVLRFKGDSKNTNLYVMGEEENEDMHYIKIEDILKKIKHGA